MSRLSLTLVSVSALCLSSACASIIEGSSDKMQVTTTPPSQSTCNVKNGRGAWNTVSNGTTEIKRSKTDVTVDCTDAATGAKGSKTVESDMESWVIGNVIAGGIIGLIVDFSTGAAWDYPETVAVSLADPVTYHSAAPVYETPQPAPVQSYVPVAPLQAAPVAASPAAVPSSTAPAGTQGIIAAPPAYMPPAY